MVVGLSKARSGAGATARLERRRFVADAASV